VEEMSENIVRLEDMKAEEERKKINHDEIQKFREATCRFLEFWQSINIKLVIGNDNNEWILLFVEITLIESDFLNEEVKISGENTSVRFIDTNISIEYFHTLLDDLESGTISIAGFPIKIDPQHFDSSRSNKWSNPCNINIGWPTTWLRGYGESRPKLIDKGRIDNELYREGYGSLHQEIEWFLQGKGSAHICIIAPLYLRIQTANIEKSLVRVAIRTHKSVSTDNLRIASPEAEGKSFRIDKKSTEANFITSDFSDILKEGSESAMVRLFYLDELEPIDQVYINKEPPEEVGGEKRLQKMDGEKSITITPEKEAFHMSFKSLHPKIIEKCSRLFDIEHYDEAIFNGMKVVEEEVRKKSGANLELIGVKLITYAMRASDPILSFGPVAGERESALFLFRGALGCFKNPNSHRFQNTNNAIIAFECLSFASLLMKMLDRHDTWFEPES